MKISEYHIYLLKKSKAPAYIRLPVMLASSWLFQGILYADKTEKCFKLALDVLFFIPAFAVLASVTNIYAALVLAFIAAHTVNWIFNGQQVALLKKFRVITKSADFERYAAGIKSRAAADTSISSIYLYGSLSRNSVKPTSDLDVRVIRKPGMINGVRSCLFGMRERIRAQVSVFPLDLYVLDSKEPLKKMRKDETPLILYKQ